MFRYQRHDGLPILSLMTVDTCATNHFRYAFWVWNELLALAFYSCEQGKLFILSMQIHFDRSENMEWLTRFA